MNITKYLTTSEALRETAQARELTGSRHLLKAAELKRDEIRKQVESKPRISDEVKDDFRYLLGFIEGMNWLISLPTEAEQNIKELKE